MNDTDYKNRVWEVSSIIKLVASMNINAICSVARSINSNFSCDDIVSIDDNIIYEAYIKQIQKTNKENIGGTL